MCIRDSRVPCVQHTRVGASARLTRRCRWRLSHRRRLSRRGGARAQPRLARSARSSGQSVGGE
eukprot:12528088-Alexandrium_andersonii.AAC.1